MTKKQFAAIAASLAALAVDLDNASADGCDNATTLAFNEHVRRMTDICAGANPAFDRARFRAACLGEGGGT